MERKQIFNNGEPSVRYRIEERIDNDHKPILVATPIQEDFVQMAVPTQEEIDKVAELRLKEALQADPTLAGKIVEPVWGGEE